MTKSYAKKEAGRSATHDRPARVAVDLVVFVVPDRAAALALVAGDGDLPVLVRYRAVGALHQFGVTPGAAPVLLYAGAGVAHLGLG